MGSLDQIPNEIKDFQRFQKNFSIIMIILAIATTVAAISTVLLSNSTGDLIKEMNIRDQERFEIDNFHPEIEIQSLGAVTVKGDKFSDFPILMKISSSTNSPHSLTLKVKEANLENGIESNVLWKMEPQVRLDNEIIKHIPAGVINQNFEIPLKFTYEINESVASGISILNTISINIEIIDFQTKESLETKEIETIIVFEALV